MSKRGSKAALFLKEVKNISYGKVKIKKVKSGINIMLQKVNLKYDTIPIKSRTDIFLCFGVSVFITIDEKGELRFSTKQVDFPTVIKKIILLNSTINFLPNDILSIIENRNWRKKNNNNIGRIIIHIAIKAAICKLYFSENKEKLIDQIRELNL